MLKTYGIFRIIGNDLKRNATGRTIQNLEFILAHETDFPNCMKTWILNRILDPEVERRLIEAIEVRAQRFFRIAHDREAAAAPASSRRERICTVIGINQARNVALSEGRKQFDWTLPFDGHCFIPDAGWDEFIEIASAAERPYIVIGMERVQTYRDALLSGTRPKCEELWEGKGWSAVEPQLAFHHTSTSTFDESLPYGDRDKAELLVRLGVPGIWHEWERPGESSIRIESTSNAECAASFVHAGFVIRLPSGRPEADTNPLTRVLLRNIGLARLIARLDGRSETLARYIPEQHGT